MAKPNFPIALIVLDGFGVAPPDPKSNAIAAADTPYFDSLIQTYPSFLLKASGLDVGLPRDEVGNSEVGHKTIGSGILQYQSLPRIDKSIASGDFFKLPDLVAAAERVKKNNSKLHFIGLLGNGGVHASQEHLEALLNFAAQHKLKDSVYVHGILDGRDTARDFGKGFVESLQAFMKKKKVGRIASLSGRFYAMDRNKNWDRTERAYKAMVRGESSQLYSDPIEAVTESYKAEVYDEEFIPVTITDKKGNPLATIDDGDVVVMFNFRADRARQLMQALTEKDFSKFPTKDFSDLEVVTFTEYEKGQNAKILFPPEIIEEPLAKIFSDHKLKQLHIAETEKYAHVTFFINGLREKAFPGEDRELIPSPAVTSYDQKPEMSAPEITQKLVENIDADAYDVYIVNYANADMVGHTGNFEATKEAIHALDKSLAQVVPAIVEKGGTVFIVADHGNAEVLENQLTTEFDKEHNPYPVPFIICNKKLEGQASPEIQDGDMSLMQPLGFLADVAPTILEAAGLPQPPEMTGSALISIPKH